MLKRWLTAKPTDINGQQIFTYRTWVLFVLSGYYTILRVIYSPSISVGYILVGILCLSFIVDLAPMKGWKPWRSKNVR